MYQKYRIGVFLYVCIIISTLPSCAPFFLVDVAAGGADFKVITLESSAFVIEQKADPEYHPSDIMDASPIYYRFYYRLKNDPFDVYDSLTVVFYYPYDDINFNEEIFEDKVTFNKSNRNKVVKGGLLRDQQATSIRPTKMLMTISDEPFRAAFVFESGKHKGTKQIGVFRKGMIREGAIIEPKGEVLYGHYNESGQYHGEMTFLLSSGKQRVMEYIDGKREGIAVVIKPDGRHSYRFYENNKNITSSYINEQVKEKLNRAENNEIKKAISPITNDINKIDNRRNNILNGNNSSYASVYNKYSDINNKSCYCIFNVCLTRKKNCDLYDGTPEGTRRSQACYDAEEAKEELRITREKSRETLCRSMRKAGLLFSEGSSFEETLRNTLLDNKKLSSSLKNEFKRAQSDLREADMLSKLLIEKRKERSKKENKLRLDQKEKREDRLSKYRREVEAKNVKYAAEKTEKNRKWRQCVTDMGFDLDKIDKWTVWPEC